MIIDSLSITIFHLYVGYFLSDHIVFVNNIVKWTVWNKSTRTTHIFSSRTTVISCLQIQLVVRCNSNNRVYKTSMVITRLLVRSSIQIEPIAIKCPVYISHLSIKIIKCKTVTTRSITPIRVISSSNRINNPASSNNNSSILNNNTKSTNKYITNRTTVIATIMIRTGVMMIVNSILKM